MLAQVSISGWRQKPELIQCLQTVFIAFMALEKKVVNIVLGAILLTLTLVAKLV
jgi:hypothetical protein